MPCTCRNNCLRIFIVVGGQHNPVRLGQRGGNLHQQRDPAGPEENLRGHPQLYRGPERDPTGKRKIGNFSYVSFIIWMI